MYSNSLGVRCSSSTYFTAINVKLWKVSRREMNRNGIAFYMQNATCARILPTRRIDFASKIIQIKREKKRDKERKRKRERGRQREMELDGTSRLPR